MRGPGDREGVVLITGGNRGIGLEVARRLAGFGHSLVLMCRKSERGRRAVEGLRGEGARHHVIVLDLSRWDSVREAAHRIKALDRPLVALINNAAVIVPKRTLNENGVELQLAVNHLGHFLLTNLLLPLLRQSSTSRVVTVSSGSHYGPPVSLEDPSFASRPYRRLEAYQQSKLANVAFSLALARRVAGSNVEAAALQPGVYDTGLWAAYTGLGRISGAFVPGPERAAAYVTRLAVVDDPDAPPDQSLNGSYFKKSRLARPAPAACDLEHQERLWAWSEAAVGLE